MEDDVAPLEDDTALIEDDRHCEDGAPDEDRAASDGEIRPHNRPGSAHHQPHWHSVRTSGRISHSSSRHQQAARSPAKLSSNVARASQKRRRNECSPSPHRSRNTSKKQRSINCDAFRPGWQHSQGTPTVGRARHAQQATGSTPATGWRTFLEPQRADSDVRRAPTAQADVRTPGAAFTEADVSFDRQYAVSMASRRQGKPRVLVQAVDEQEEGSISGGQQKRQRRRRRAPADVPEDESRSTRNLPDFVKPLIDTEIVPTVINYVGTKRDPWDMREHGRDELLQICQDVFNLVCPRNAYDLEKDDLIYKIVRQKVYQWRSNFANAAIAVIGETMDLKFGKTPSRSAVHRWVSSAIADGGEAFWAQPHSDPSQAHGKLQSIYILKCFATHLEATAGAVKDYGYPGGALALSVAAVKHCFPMFRDGKFKPGKPFCSQNARASTESWYDTSVYRFVDKPERFDAIIRMASKHMGGTPKRQATRVEGAQAPSVFDRSSPPVESYD
ncbi:hypothetical protein OH77DRAFT_969345 [Trametes cingulata]|nr:hypothetical protein OH77DRAFT_969345 [Trametes cingulata]